ncbi:MAG TPA: alpha-glucan family phosphorylase, partial [Candidatus Acidoferrales bacterium]|nr:alpha-glucan family phosphorylase [Candidatus Acidoferrales bacterium]
SRETGLSAEGTSGTDYLVELALDLRWSWNHAADELWRRLDPALWESTRNPWLILQTVSRDQLRTMLEDQGFREKLETLVQERRNAAAAPSWFRDRFPQAPLTSVAYFSMEFMLSEALPIYSGGLGNVSGDQLKSASDLGVPVVGVGLLYQQGYFRQAISRDGAQQAFYPYNDPGQLPITPLREPNGEWLRLELAFPGYSVWLRGWQVQVGRSWLYLLDSNDPVNLPAHRGITSELYGGGPELRLQQELILGVGGWRLLRALGIKPEVCHLNEGHAAFAVLERALDHMEETGKPFDVSLTVTRAGNLFTTHTPVEAGFDRFPPELIEHYLRDYSEQKLHIPLNALLALGRRNGNDRGEPFNMAYLAIRGSGGVNGVSRLHGAVSRRIFQPLFPRWPQHEIPIKHITNGVHMPSWDSARADEFWTTHCGKERWMGTTEMLGDVVRSASDADLWQLRTAGSKTLVEYVRKRLSLQLTASGTSPEELAVVEQIFEADTLTLGFARRFATYKRPNLLLHDPDRLLRLLTNPNRPVQLVIAGKAHPADQAGQLMIQEWARFIRRPQTRRHVALLSDYDMLMAEQLVQGVDLWINTPRRPWEASGTSGMKVLVNGGLNLSELDGWWAEAYSPQVGWAIGDGQEHDDDPLWDAAEAEALYTLLEQEVVPEFYSRNDRGIPTAWVARMRESMARLTPFFSANRTVREYTEKNYVPFAEAYCRRLADKGALGEELVRWRNSIELHWSSLRFGEVKIETEQNWHTFHVQVYLNDLDPEAIQLELFADPLNGGEVIHQKMERGEQLVAARGFSYSARVPASRPATDYTPRVLPFHPAAQVPLEEPRILWQR